jgi:hypothetical protein
MPKAGRPFEEITERIFRALEPGAKITSPGALPDRAMTEPREVDVLVQGKVRGQDLGVLMVECRDHKKPVSVGYVESVITKRDDVSADFAVVVSAEGFTRGAAEKASAHGIELLTLERAEVQDWSAWLLARFVDCYTPHVWIYHIDTEVIGSKGDDVDLSGEIVPGLGLNVMTPLFYDPTGYRLSAVELLNQALIENPASCPDIPTNGERIRRRVDIRLGQELTLRTKAGNMSRVTSATMVVDLWREKTQHPLIGRQLISINGDTIAHYADAIVTLADMQGRMTRSVRFSIIRDAVGRLQVSAVHDGPHDRGGPAAQRGRGTRKKKGARR